MYKMSHLHYIELEGVDYPLREICFEDAYCLVGTESLNKRLLDECGQYVSDRAKCIDEQILFFVPDKEIDSPDSCIHKILLDNIL